MMNLEIFRGERRSVNVWHSLENDGLIIGLELRENDGQEETMTIAMLWKLCFFRVKRNTRKQTRRR